MLRQTWILLLCGALISGCASRSPKLEAPNVRIVSLVMTQPGNVSAQPYELVLRIRNTSEIEMVVDSYQLELTLDGHSAGLHSAQVELAIPVLSNENVQATGQLNAAQARALVSLQKGQRGQMPYALKGVLNSQGRSFTLAYDGWLSRSPGKAGSFR